ncbi:hypothetical protein EIP91_002050 [Steccherinum ochraceum]|uniref:Uncharacterized protein n=1 Tax=Steccherinum ochraceum TaxID=92696 RepID=A0A4R0RCS8_9APHY|nr:hypothetical protein EIP91_002050 [Steccherinum ochraceum]
MSLQSAPIPIFEPLFAISVSMGDKHAMHGSFGTRSNKPLLGGDVKDAAGKTVGQIVPNTSASYGVVDAYGTYHPSVSMTIQWRSDHSFAYLNLNGVGVLGKPTTVYIHLEADAGSSYSWLNSRFLIGKVSHSPDGSTAFFDIFTLQEGLPHEKEEKSEMTNQQPTLVPLTA